MPVPTTPTQVGAIPGVVNYTPPPGTSLTPPATPLPSSPAPANGQTTVSSTSNVGSGTNQSTGTTQAREVFTPGQEQLQSTLPGVWNGLINGTSQVPAYMTAPPQVFDAANAAFNKNVAPGIAAQFGAGSPQAMAQKTYMNQQLAANLYQSGIQNWMNMLGGAGAAAYHGVGSDTTQQAQGANSTQAAGTGITSNTMGGSLLALLLGLKNGSI